jgi:3-oxoacyl-[acyl-carrier protein] reductase
MALGLARAGHAVAACDLPDSDPELKTLAATAGGLRLKPFHIDVTDSGSVAAAVDAAEAEFGGIDVLVNNAGIGMQLITPHIHASPLKFYEIEEDFWRRMLDVNLVGAVRTGKILVPRLVARGFGSIINVTTSLTTMTRRGFSPYGPAKAALEALSAIWAQELEGTGVTVNVLVPGGPADTRMIPPEDTADRASLIAPERMVPPLLWLVSDAASGISGRRFIAKLWDPNAAPGEAAQKAGAPVAWR